MSIRFGAVFCHVMLSTGLAGLLAAPAIAAADLTDPTSSGSGGPGLGRGTRTSYWFWRNYVYVDGGSYLDDDSWVEGGIIALTERTENVVMVVARPDDESDWNTRWHFIRGKEFKFKAISSTDPPITLGAARGQYVASADGKWGSAKYSDRLGLSYVLANFAHRDTRAISAPYFKKLTAADKDMPIRHAQAIANMAGLKLIVLGANQTGNVADQYPAGGSSMPPDGTLIVTLDGATDAVGKATGDSATPGNKFDKPFLIPNLDHGGAVAEFMTKGFEDTVKCKDEAGCDDCDNDKDYIDAVFRLPEKAMGKRVKVIVGAGDRFAPMVRLYAVSTNAGGSGVVKQLCCAEKGRRPAIEFDAPSAASGDVAFVVIDINPGALDDGDTNAKDNACELIRFTAKW